MTTTIQSIFREIQTEGQSLSMARRAIVEEAVKFNGEMATSMMQEVAIREGSTFEISRNLWVRLDEKWVKQ